jgi:Domain of unknown function (DUF1963)
VFDSLDDLQTAFDDIGMTELGHDMVRSAKVGLRADYIDGGPHQLGGTPLLPEGTPWPTRLPLIGVEQYAKRMDPEVADSWALEQPLTFVAEVDLSKIVGVSGSPLPSDGRLLFFWDDTWGCYADPADSGRVLYLAGDLAGARPGELKAWPRKSFRLIPGITVPERDLAEEFSDHVPEYSFECEYGHLIEARIHTWDETDDRVLGWAAAIQEEPFLRIGMTEHTEWTLLLQVDLAHATDNAYQEGVLYFIAPTGDIAEGRFDRVYADYQQS